MPDWLSWTAQYAGPTVLVAILALVGQEWIKGTLRGAVDQTLNEQKKAHAAELQKQQQEHTRALEAFKQQYQTLEAERSRSFSSLLEGQRHEYAKVLEGTKADIERRDEWRRHEVDALVALNAIFLSLIPEPTTPHPEMSDVYEHIEEEATEYAEAVRRFREAHSVFLPPDVEARVESGLTQLRFCRFDPNDAPHIEGSGRGAYQEFATALGAMKDHVRGPLQESEPA